MSKKSTEIFSVFGQCEAVAAEMMIKEGKVTHIPPEQIPLAVAFNDMGQTARFAVMVPARYVPEFNRRCAEMRA